MFKIILNILGLVVLAVVGYAGIIKLSQWYSTK